MMRAFWALAVSVLPLAAGLVPRPASAQAETGAPLAFVVLGPDRAAVARAITTAADCPAIALDSTSRRMSVRAPPAEPEFPVLVCEAQVPPGTASVSVAGQPLPLPRNAPERIVALGDTGCRLKAGHVFQACREPGAWPFGELAAGAAAWGPDLVVHVGDYLYREQACPAGDTGCAGSPTGDTWAAWRADFFDPAAPLLRAAPWVATRGDHELCSRAGGGFFRFLDPRPLPVRCPDQTEPYPVQAGELRLVVMDASDAADEHPPPELVRAYAEQFAAVRGMVSGRTWLAMHKPLWAPLPPGRGDAHDGRVPTDLNPTLQAASGNALPAGIEAVLSGHIHLFQALGFADGRPPQFVLGTGGTELDPPIVGTLAGRAVAGTQVANGLAVARFGFATLERSGRGWTVTLRDARGAAQGACVVFTAGLDCTR
jgi:Calcineurin-like phosphoesterase